MAPSARAALIYSSLGHFLMHLATASYPIVVLGIERDWGLPYSDLLQLWTLGALLVGVLALPAGWLADRWNAPAMIVVSFFGLGLSMLACALAPSPRWLWAGLTLLGAFGAIYHPVGIPWLVRMTGGQRGGTALGVNGIFGSGGVAAAGLLVGGTMALFGWRAAFIAPGLISIGFGIAMLIAMRRGLADYVPVPAPEPSPTGRAPAGRATFVLTSVLLASATFMTSLIYQTTQAALPKALELRTFASTGDAPLAVGTLVAIVYAVAAMTQLLAGRLADRHALLSIYAWMFVAQVPVIAFLGVASGLALPAAAIVAVALNTGLLPAESLLLAKSAPPRRHGVFFGLRFVLAFGAAPIAVAAVAWCYRVTGDLRAIFLALAGCAVLGSALAARLRAMTRQDTNAATQAA